MSTSPCGASATAATLGDVPSASSGVEHVLVSPWGATLAATALGLGPEPDLKADSATLVSPWGALLAAAALGLPSVDAPSGAGSEAKAHKSSSSGPKPAASGAFGPTSGQQSARVPMSVTVPMLSELLLPFHPTDAMHTGFGIMGGGGGGTSVRASASGLSPAGLQPAASRNLMGSEPLPKMSIGGNSSASALGGQSATLHPRVLSRSSNGSPLPYGSPPTSEGLQKVIGSPHLPSGPSHLTVVHGGPMGSATHPTPFAQASGVVGRTSDSSASASFASPSVTMLPGASTLQHKMTGRLATVEPNPSVRFELDWAT